MFALRERRQHVTQEDFEMAVSKVMKCLVTERKNEWRKCWGESWKKYQPPFKGVGVVSGGRGVIKRKHVSNCQMAHFFSDFKGVRRCR